MFAGQQAVSQEKHAKDNCISYLHEQLDKQVFRVASSEPDYPGGAPAFMRFLNKTLRYPQAMNDNGEYPPPSHMEFIVDEDGMIKFPTINRKQDTTTYDAYEKELLRIVKAMPKVNLLPAMANQ